MMNPIHLLLVLCIILLFSIMLQVNTLTELTTIHNNTIEEMQPKIGKSIIVKTTISTNTDDTELRPLFNALWEQESSSSLNPPDGDEGSSIGPYQVSLAYWTDANMPNGTYEDCRDKDYSEEVMRRYWKRYKARTNEQRARTHVGGPDGATLKKDKTDKYWNDVNKILNKNKETKK